MPVDDNGNDGKGRIVRVEDRRGIRLRVSGGRLDLAWARFDSAAKVYRLDVGIEREVLLGRKLIRLDGKWRTRGEQRLERVVAVEVRVGLAVSVGLVRIESSEHEIHPF